MDEETRIKAHKIAVAVTYIAMIAVNALAQLLPINGVTIGQVSDSLPNLFVPAGLTFSIWSVIYLMLAAFTIYQSGLVWQQGGTPSIDRVRVLFVISSLANIAWVFSWHYGYITVSMGLMLVILLSLAAANLYLDKREMTRLEKVCLKLPFSLYFGWITVATVANATSLLVKSGWDRFGFTEQLWAVIILLVAAAIGTLTTLVRKDFAYGLVLIWAYIGILVKHTSTSGFSGAYPSVIVTAILCLVLFAAAEALLVIRTVNKSKLSR